MSKYLTRNWCFKILKLSPLRFWNLFQIETINKCGIVLDWSIKNCLVIYWHFSKLLNQTLKPFDAIWNWRNANLSIIVQFSYEIFYIWIIGIEDAKNFIIILLWCCINCTILEYSSEWNWIINYQLNPSKWYT